MATGTVGEPFTLDLTTIESRVSQAEPSNIPPGLEWDGPERTIEGTPTEPGEWEVAYTFQGTYGIETGYYTITVEGGDGPGPGPDDPGRVSRSVVVGVLVELDIPAALDVPEPDEPVVDPIPAGMTHTGAGVLVGRPTDEGDLEVELRDGDQLVGTVDLLILPEGSQATDDPWAVWDDLAASLAPRVAAMVGQHGDEGTVETAKSQLPLVAEYVRGYTRGRGFDGSAPAGPLLAVIVSATARLATNPEQVSAYTMGDYSERPARLAGWTLAEIGVLHRYRVVSA